MPPTLIERYMRGEHESVWHALRALGTEVQKPAVRDDAIAVARETVRRAKLNLRSLIEELPRIGYRFDHSRAGVLSDPAKTIARRLDAFERDLGGPMPLVLRAWYEQIGSVSLLGSHPMFCPRTAAGTTMAGALSPAPLESMRVQVSADPFAMDSFDPPRFEHAADQGRRTQDAEARLREFDETMARMRASMPDALRDVFVQTEEKLRPNREKLELAVREASQPRAFHLALGPDDVMKFGESGDSYYVALPDGQADFLLHTTGPAETFVEYLRRSFRCAGLAGWDGRPDIPIELRRLGASLLPV